MWKFLMVLGLLVSSSAFAAGGEAACAGYTSKRIGHAFCLAYHGNRMRCSSLDEPFESWCEGVSKLSTSHCSNSALSEHEHNICRALVNDTYTRCSTGMDRSSDEARSAEAFCVSLVKQDASRCSRVGFLTPDCRQIVTARLAMAAGDANAMETRAVPLEVLRHLEQADEAVAAARAHIPDGAGNQEKEIEASNGHSTARLVAARRMPTPSVLALAASAAYTGGANCGEFAALTYAALLAQGVEGKPVLQGGLKDLDHAFTMIGDPREKGPSVVVDAWVSNPQGVAWADSCWKDPKYGGFEIVEQYNDSRPNPAYDLSGITAPSMSDAEARRILQVPDGVSLVDHVKKELKDHLWEQEYATDVDAPIAYTPDGRSRRR